MDAVSLAVAAGLAGSAKAYADAKIAEAIAALPKGVVWRGSVNYYADLPATPEEGDCYTVKYAGSSGTSPSGQEYAWGKYDGVNQWIPIGPDMSVYRTAAAQDVIDATKQDTIISSGATVGQFARITSVDANGKPTGWEPVTVAPCTDANAVHYTADSGRTDAEKAIARANIGAASAESYDFMFKLVAGYSITLSEPVDWSTNYTDYFINTGTAIEPVYTAVTGESAPTWESGKYYSFDGDNLVELQCYFGYPVKKLCFVATVEPWVSQPESQVTLIGDNYSLWYEVMGFAKTTRQTFSLNYEAITDWYFSVEYGEGSYMYRQQVKRWFCRPTFSHDSYARGLYIPNSPPNTTLYCYGVRA